MFLFLSIYFMRVISFIRLFDLSQAGYDKGDTVLVSGTDGVGTKLKVTLYLDIVVSLYAKINMVLYLDVVLLFYMFHTDDVT